MNPMDLDRRLARRHFSRAADTYSAAAALQHEVEDRLLERLDLLPEFEGLVVDAGCGPGRASHALKKRYKKARVLSLDFALPMLKQIRPGWRKPIMRVAGDIRALPMRAGSVDLMFSSLALQWCEPLDKTLLEIGRVLKPGAPVLFTTFGADTLMELRQAWHQADPGVPHVHTFRDLREIGDLMMKLGFVNPVIDVDEFILNYSDVFELMRELKAIGAHNAARDRRSGLTGRATLNRLLDQCEQQMEAGQLPSTWQVVYGHATAPETAATHRDGDTTIATFPVEKLKRRR